MNTSLQKQDIKTFDLLPQKWAFLVSSVLGKELPAYDKVSIWFFTYGEKNDKVGTFGMNIFETIDNKKKKCVLKVKFVKGEFHFKDVSIVDNELRDILRKLCQEHLKTVQ